MSPTAFELPILQEYAPGTVPDRILAAAETHFVKYGYSGARVDAIALTAEVNKSLIYRHFGSKQDLYCKVLYKSWKELASFSEGILSLKLAPEQLVRALIQGYFGYLKTHRNYVELLCWEMRSGIQKVESFGLRRALVDRVVLVLERAQKDGYIRQDIPARLLIVMAMNLCLSYFANKAYMQDFFDGDLEDPQLQDTWEQWVIQLLLGLDPQGEE